MGLTVSVAEDILPPLRRLCFHRFVWWF